MKSNKPKYIVRPVLVRYDSGTYCVRYMIFKRFLWFFYYNLGGEKFNEENHLAEIVKKLNKMEG